VIAKSKFGLFCSIFYNLSMFTVGFGFDVVAVAVVAVAAVVDAN
jgi:hypothetical protein